MEDRTKAREEVLAKLNKNFGKGTIMRYSDQEPVNVRTVSSGSIAIDIASGVGGYPRGRIVEVFGSEASGKTTLTLHAIAEVQKAGGTAAFIDAEHALDPVYAEALGVSMDDLYLSQPDYGEQALEIAEKLTSSGAFDIVVIDSVAALTPKAEIEGEMGDHHVGLQARLMSQGLRKLAGVVHRTNTILIFINQTRMKIGVMFGSPTTTSGGKSLPFYASQRLEVARIQTLKKGEDMIGGRTRVKFVKNKVAPPFRKAEFDIIFGQGINYFGELLDIGVVLGFVDKSGAWYSTLDGDRMGQGRDQAIAFLQDNPKEAATIDRAIRKHYLLVKDDDAETETD